MKKFLIIFIVILGIVAGVLFGMYQFIPEFKEMSNQILRFAPGPVGEHFEKMSSPEEINRQLEEAALYILELEEDRAVDKLSIIEKEDPKLYDDLIVKCLKVNPNRTQKLLTLIREKSLEPNSLLTLMAQREEEEKKSYEAIANSIATASDPAALSYLEDVKKDNIRAYETMAGIFMNLEDARIVRILKHFSMKEADEIFKYMSKEKVESIKRLQSFEASKKTDIARDITILKSKKPEAVLKEAGNTNTYHMGDLAIIYIGLGPKLAGEVLSLSNDENFKKDLISEIKNHLMLTYSEDKFTDDLLKAMSVYRDYRDNIASLVAIYSQADEQKIAKIIDNLYWKSGGKKEYVLKNGQSIVIDDKDIAVKLLKSFPDKKIAEILGYLDNSIATEISTKLALPND